VTAEEVGFCRRSAFDEGEAFVEDRDPLLRLGVASSRVEVRERAVAYEVDR